MCLSASGFSSIYTFVLRGAQPAVRYPGTAPQVLLPPGAAPVANPADADQRLLDTLALESGGRSVLFALHSPNFVEEMIDFVEEIAAELRGQYTLGYYPQSELKPTDVIRVRTTSSNYQVRVRRDDFKVGEAP